MGCIAVLITNVIFWVWTFVLIRNINKNFNIRLYKQSKWILEFLVIYVMYVQLCSNCFDLLYGILFSVCTCLIYLDILCIRFESCIWEKS